MSNESSRRVMRMLAIVARTSPGRSGRRLQGLGRSPTSSASSMPGTHAITVQATCRHFASWAPIDRPDDADLVAGLLPRRGLRRAGADVVAETPDGQPLPSRRPQRQSLARRHARRTRVTLSYRVFCNQRSVTTNEVTRDYGVLNGAPTFITLAENARRAARRAHRVAGGLDARDDRARRRAGWQTESVPRR